MLSRPFLVLYAAVFVGTMGISMVSPLLPVYAEELGATGIWIGLTFSIFAVTQTIFGPFVGRWSDRYGRKPFIVAGLLLYFVAALGYLTAETFVQVMVFRALSGVGTSMIFSVARAYIGDMVPPGHEGRWFGLFQTADIVGFGIGPLIAGVLRSATGFDSVFIAMACLMASSAAIVATLLPRHGRDQRLPVGLERVKDLSFAIAMRDRLVTAVTLNMALVSLSFGATFSFIAVKLEAIDVGPVLIGVAFAMESLSSGISQPFLGFLVDRYDRRLIVACGLTISASVLVGVGLVNNLAPVIVLLLGLGLGNALASVAGGALQIVAGRRVGMGTVIGLGSAGNGAGIVVGSVIGGIFVDWFNLDATFFFGGAAMLAGVPLFLYLTRGVPTREEEVPRPPSQRTIESTPSRAVAGEAHPGGG